MGFGSAQCDFRYSERKHNKCHTNATFTAATLQLLILLSTLQLLYKKKDMAQKNDVLRIKLFSVKVECSINSSFRTVGIVESRITMGMSGCMDRSDKMPSDPNCYLLNTLLVYLIDIQYVFLHIHLGFVLFNIF